MKLLRLFLSGSALLLATGCAAGGNDALLRSHGLEGADTRQVIEQLDQTNDDRDTGLSASVTYDAVVLQDQDDEVVLPMPEDEFYLSVAPWITTTHDCFQHSLSGCQGELVDTPLQVVITDSAGEVLMDGAARTYENGFVGFWLPKDITGTLEISSAEGTASREFSTFEDSPTCLTTMQLA